MGYRSPQSPISPVKDLRSPLLQGGPILLYDGDCGVCNRAVQWILRHERRKTLRFAALNSRAGRQLRALAGVDSQIDSLLWLEEHQGRIECSVWSDSVLATISYVGGPWALLNGVRWLPKVLRDHAYRFFARHRQKLPTKFCHLPTPDERTRFLD